MQPSGRDTLLRDRKQHTDEGVRMGAVVDASPQDPVASSGLYVAVVLACFSPLLFGSSLAFTSPSETAMEGNDSLHVMSKSQFSQYASLINIGAVLGAFSGSFMADRFGRRTTLAFTAVPHLLGWVGTSVASDFITFCALRLLLGWAVGLGSAVTPVYISEVATTGLRGSLGAANQLSVTIGILVSNLAGSSVFVFQERNKTDDKIETFCQWKQLCYANAVLAVVLAFSILLPESPRWLAKKGRSDATIASLRRLRKGDSSSEALGLLEESHSSQDGIRRSNPTSSLSVQMVRRKKSLVIGVGLCVFQQFSGINAIIFFTTNICEQAGMADPSLGSVFCMGAQVVLTLISCLLMEKAGRRMLLLFASLSMAGSSFLMAFYFITPTGDLPSFVALIGLCVFIVGFSLGMGPIPWLILGEIFPTEIVGIASSLATATNWTSSFIVTLTFKPLQDVLGGYVFVIFGVICVICFAFVYALVPETRGKTVEEVLAILEGRSAAQVREVALRNQDS